MLGGKFLNKSTSILFGVTSFILAMAAFAHPALADDTNISSLSASASSSEPSASATYTLSFTTAQSLPAGTVVAWTMVAEVGTLNESQVTTSSMSSTLVGTPSVMTIQGSLKLYSYTLSSAAAAGSYTITIANLTNPSSSDSVLINMTTAGLAGMASNTDMTTVTIGSGTGGGGDGGSGPGDATGENTVTVSVVDENGSPLASQPVWGYCGMSFDEASSDTSGIAVLSGLTNGNCGIELSTSGGYFSETQFFTFVSSDSPQTESVTLTGEVLDTTLTLTVTDDQGDPVQNVYLRIVDPNGREFTSSTTEDGAAGIPIDYGTYKIMGFYGDDTQYFPETEVTVSEDSSTQSAFLQLVAYTSFIKGTVTDPNGVALASPNILVISDGNIRFTKGETDGSFSLGVLPGVHTLKAESTGYANGVLRDITIKKNQTKTGQKIELGTADNTLNLSVVDDQGAANTSISGGVMCKDPVGFDPISVYFTFMSSGVATFTLPDGDFSCSLFTSGYATDTPTFTLAGGETEAGQITIQSYDSTLVVSLVDENGNAVNDARFGIFGENNSGGKTINGFSQGGQTSIGAAAGTYTLRAFVMSGEYMTDYTNPTVTTLVAGEQTTATITIYSKSATLSGTIVDANGSAVDGAQVTAKGAGSKNPFSFHTITDDQGDYSMSVVPGTYSVTAAKEGVENLPSIPQTAKLKDGSAKDVDASLEKTNATLTVTPTESSSEDISNGSCYAFEADGTYVSEDITDGSAALAVNPGDWHYGCRALVGNKEFITKSEGVVTIAKGDSASVETEITSGGVGFENVIYQFSATADTTLSLPDGTTIFVPANALDTSGSVSISASSASSVGVDDSSFPILPVTLEARDSNGGLITGDFNSQVTITFHYTAKQLNQNGVDEDDVQGDTFKNDTWSTTDEGYTVKKGADYVSITTSHFSTFGLVAPIHLPKIPKGLMTKKLTSSSVKIQWTAPKSSKVESYTTQVRPTGSTQHSDMTSTTGITTTASNVTDLTSGTGYEFRVKACNSVGCGKYSGWKSFTTRDASGM